MAGMLPARAAHGGIQQGMFPDGPLGQLLQGTGCKEKAFTAKYMVVSGSKCYLSNASTGFWKNLWLVGAGAALY